jgi:hypothetical protein
MRDCPCPVAASSGGPSTAAIERRFEGPTAALTHRRKLPRDAHLQRRSRAASPRNPKQRNLSGSPRAAAPAHGDRFSRCPGLRRHRPRPRHRRSTTRAARRPPRRAVRDAMGAARRVIATPGARRSWTPFACGVAFADGRNAGPGSSSARARGSGARRNLPLQFVREESTGSAFRPRRSG